MDTTRIASPTDADTGALGTPNIYSIAFPALKPLNSIEDAAVLLSIGRSKMWELVSTGQIKTVPLGRRTLVPAQEILAFADRLGRQGAGEGDLGDQPTAA